MPSLLRPNLPLPPSRARPLKLKAMATAWDGRVMSRLKVNLPMGRPYPTVKRGRDASMVPALSTSTIPRKKRSRILKPVRNGSAKSTVHAIVKLLPVCSYRYIRIRSSVTHRPLCVPPWVNGILFSGGTIRPTPDKFGNV